MQMACIWDPLFLEDLNEDADLKMIYNDEYVIALDELPELSGGK